MKFIIHIFICLTLCNNVSLYASQKYSWLYYNSELNRVDEVDRPREGEKYSSLVLKRYMESELSLEVKKGLAVYINGMMHGVYTQDKNVKINLLPYKRGDFGFYLITFFHDDFDFPDLLVNENAHKKYNESSDYIERSKSQKIYFLWYGLGLLLLLLILIKVFYPDIYYFLFQDFLSSWFKVGLVDLVFNRLLAMFILSSLLISLCFSILLSFEDEMHSAFYVDNVSNWFMGVLFFLIIKAITAYLISTIYNYDIHKTLILSYSKLLFNIVLTVLVLFFVTNRMLHFSIEYIRILLIVLLVAITLNQSWCIVNYQRFRKIYLFSYLCTAELIPLLISIKLLM